jgi:hypothetical protein
MENRKVNTNEKKIDEIFELMRELSLRKQKIDNYLNYLDILHDLATQEKLVILEQESELENSFNALLTIPE